MKSYRRFLKNAKAVSPVIATIIIVAIAIVMSIAVAYWMLGLGQSFTKYEKVEFTTAYVTGTETSTFIIHMDLKNTGSAAASIDPTYILYNGMPRTAYPAAMPDISGFNGGITLTLQPGESKTDQMITLVGGTTWKSGMTIEVTLHSTGGKDYPKVITLP